jgi:hypothetical protein
MKTSKKQLSLALLVLIIAISASAQSGLPSGIGWHALPSSTSLLSSGACPPDYFGGDTYYFNYTCQVVIRGNSGAIADTTRNRLILWGGGGGSYYGNEIFSLNLYANPVTLTRLTDPTVPSNFSNRSNCIETLPPSSSGTAPNDRSTFGGLVYLPAADRMFAVGGSLSCSNGNGTRNSWTIPFNGLSSTAWQHMDPTLTGTPPGINGGNTLFGMIADYDPKTGLVFVSDSRALYTYNNASNTYKQISPIYGFSTSGSMYGGIDPLRRLFVAVGNCPHGTCYSNTGVIVADISNPASTIGQNWTAATMADPNCAQFLSGGVSPLFYGDHAPGLTYDTVANTFVGWPNEGDSVYIITPDVANKRLTCQMLNFSGGPPNSAHQGSNSTNGTYGRFRYFPGPDAFVLINDYNIPAYILRLRDNTVPAPVATLSAISLTFPNQYLNTTSARKTVTLTNTGSATLNVSAPLGISGDFGETDNCAGAGLAISASCSISVTFTPTATGSRTGMLTITDNAGSGQQTVSLSGQGVTPATLNSITVTPSGATILVNATQPFHASGNYSDGSTQDLTPQVAWASSNPQVATISANVATGIAIGSTTITATLGSTSSSVTLTVANNALPTGIGWHALGASTSIHGSGACPPNYFNGDTYYFNYTCETGVVIRAWNGAIADTAGNQLLIWGGGHTNYYGNEIYSLNLTANPVTLTRIKDPTVPSNYINRATCVAGIPPGQPNFAANSRETYAGLAYLPGPDRMYAFGGSLACTQGSSLLDTWTIPLQGLSSSTQWQHMDPTITINGAFHPGAAGGNPGIGVIADYDPNSGLVFLADTNMLYSYNYATNTYTQLTPYYGSYISEALSGGVDPVRKLFVVLGNCPNRTCSAGNGVFVANISNPVSVVVQDWTAATMADSNCAEFLAGGGTPLASGFTPNNEAWSPGITYDTVSQTFVGWPNEGNSVYLMSPDVVNKRLTCQKRTFPNGPPNSAHQGPNTTSGTFGRFRYFSSLDVFVLVNDYNIPAYILRLR